MSDEEGHDGTGGSSATYAQTFNEPVTNVSSNFPTSTSCFAAKRRSSRELEAWKEKYNNYFVISRLDRESSPYQRAMFKHTIGDDALKVIKTFSYTEGEDSGNWRVVMDKMEKCCIGEVNAEIYERYCFNKRDKLPTESVDCFVAELKTLAKTCNFCDCLRDSLIRDRIVLGIKDEQTTKKLLRIRDLTLNRCIDICRSEEVTALHMKSLSEPVDNINQVKCN